MKINLFIFLTTITLLLSANTKAQLTGKNCKECNNRINQIFFDQTEFQTFLSIVKKMPYTEESKSLPSDTKTEKTYKLSDSLTFIVYDYKNGHQLNMIHFLVPESNKYGQPMWVCNSISETGEYLWFWGMSYPPQGFHLFPSHIYSFREKILDLLKTGGTNYVPSSCEDYIKQMMLDETTKEKAELKKGIEKRNAVSKSFIDSIFNVRLSDKAVKISFSAFDYGGVGYMELDAASNNLIVYVKTMGKGKNKNRLIKFKLIDDPWFSDGQISRRFGRGFKEFVPQNATIITLDNSTKKFEIEQSGYNPNDGGEMIYGTYFSINGWEINPGGKPKFFENDEAELKALLE